MFWLIFPVCVPLSHFLRFTYCLMRVSTLAALFGSTSQHTSQSPTNCTYIFLSKKQRAIKTRYYCIPRTHYTTHNSFYGGFILQQFYCLRLTATMQRRLIYCNYCAGSFCSIGRIPSRPIVEGIIIIIITIIIELLTSQL